MNANRGIPKGFQSRLVKQKFPEERPIFWGPNQSTTYPDQYNEPSDWRVNELMKIPAVIRFIRSGNFTSLRRMFGIGYVNLITVHWHIQNSFLGNFAISHTHVYDFTPVFDLPTGSNLTALDCLQRFWTGSEKDIDANSPGNNVTGQKIISNLFAGFEFQPRTNIIGGAYQHPVFLPNSGTPLGAPAAFNPPPPSIEFEADPTVTFSFNSEKRCRWIFIYHQIEGSSQYGCLGLGAIQIGWDQPENNPGTESQEFILEERNYIPDLVVPQ